MQNGLMVYHCKRTSQPNADIETFAQPVAYRLGLGYLTIQPASGYNEIVEFGDKIARTWTAFAQPYSQWVDNLKEGDRFYVDGLTPTYEIDDETKLPIEPEDGWGYDANARIYSVRPQNTAVKFLLQKIE